MAWYLMDETQRPYRHTKIVATIGPATESLEKLEALIAAGVDIIRLNMAHGSVEWVSEIIARIRQASANVDRHVAVMMDVKGPEVRTGPVDTPMQLAKGDRLELHTGDFEALNDGVHRVSVNYPDLPGDVDVGAMVLIDSGLLRTRVLEKNSARVVLEVLTPGVMGSRRHINLPGTQVNLPALTDKDKNDLCAGIAAGLDFVALSFVRQAEDIRTLRSYLDEQGCQARIIAKIEDQAGVRNMDEIIHETDGVMVARGDLGIEIEYHKLPLVQTQLVRACQSEGKPVIIATHLLESMIQSPIPTRAEISDVSNAIREQADAIMLSGETTTGAYPLESVEVLKNIVTSIEPSVERPINDRIQLHEPKSKMLRSSVVLAKELGQSGVVVFTRSGFLAYVLGAMRAHEVPIYAFTDVQSTFHQLMLPWGVEPFLIEFSDDPEETIQDALNVLLKKNWCKPGSWLVVITNALADDKIIDTLQLRQIGVEDA
ncbi:pyruvate kinase [Stieleria sp. TO1_6]|uniref:pyruvate kinase n=1 Tax=Stieleria tagensis TaxID=2956795 RepID=UPI00209A6582|nr:pyruvate kinase [Stieleria tagensis]MCO8122424.1 pyruvate kinase [Stieleria tagensis]